VANAASQARAGGSVGSRYGLAEAGCAWSEAEQVLVLVHGRDREPEELVKPLLETHPLSHVKILAPWIESRCWYEGRYDAPRAAHAEALDAGLAHIAAAVAKARGAGAPVVLAGFSQGGCMVAEYLLTRGADDLTAAAIFTGSALDPRAEREGAADLSGLPVILSGGAADPWLPVIDLERTADLLASAGARTEVTTFDDQEHVVRPAEFARLAALLSGKPEPRNTGTAPAAGQDQAL